MLHDMVQEALVFCFDSATVPISVQLRRRGVRKILSTPLPPSFLGGLVVGYQGKEVRFSIHLNTAQSQAQQVMNLVYALAQTFEFEDDGDGSFCDSDASEGAPKEDREDFRQWFVEHWMAVNNNLERAQEFVRLISELQN